MSDDQQINYRSRSLPTAEIGMHRRRLHNTMLQYNVFVYIPEVWVLTVKKKNDNIEYLYRLPRINEKNIQRLNIWTL